jgi:hypothetical protein
MRVRKAYGYLPAVIGLCGATAAQAEWLAQATLLREAKAGAESDPCTAALAVRLEVLDEDLIFTTERPKQTECKTQPAPEPQKYKVVMIRYAGGVKTYEAQNENERLVLTDRRGPDGEPAWHVAIKEPLEAGKTRMEYSGNDIEDRNLSARGFEKHDLVLFLTQALPQRELRLLVYPLLLDSIQAMPGPPARPKAYQIRISSDLPLAQVLPQLKRLELVTEVAPVVDSENPTEPRP